MKFRQCITGMMIDLPFGVGDRVISTMTNRVVKEITGNTIYFDNGEAIQKSSLESGYYLVKPIGKDDYIPAVELGYKPKNDSKCIALMKKSVNFDFETTKIFGGEDTWISISNGDIWINHNPCAESHIQDAISYALEDTNPFKFPDYAINPYKEKEEMIELKLEVLGVNIYKATPDQLIALIKDLNKRIEAFEDVPVESTYVEGEIRKLTKAMKKVVKELDSRAS